MSHFTVMVIKRKGTKKDYEQILAPYDEELTVAPYISKSRVELIEYGKKRIKELEENERLNEYLKDPVAFEAKEGKSTAEYCQKEAAYLKDYQTRKWEDADYHAYATRYDDPNELDAEGNEISTYNPNSKWDWYMVGGRWPDSLHLKDGSHADSALAKDIDWDSMHKVSEDAKDHATKFWHAYVLDEMATDPAQKKWYDETCQFTFYKRDYFLEKYGTLEKYIRYLGQWTTYAVADCKGWYAPGEMGWFGCSSESVDEENDWSENFRSRFIDTLDPEDEVTIVDCHI